MSTVRVIGAVRSGHGRSAHPTPDDRHAPLHTDRWHESCPLCGCPRLRALYAYVRSHLVRCGGCGTTFAGRLPTDAELEAHYRDYGHAWHDSPITRLRYRELLDTFEAYRQTNRMLDVGCGAGLFLEEARARGWEVHGVERR